MVSVIITTYNRRDFLQEAVESVLGQDYEDTEIIIVDDGSTDGSFDVVRGLPVHYAWKENGGISSARNLGISLCQGDYVAFLDVDDLWKRHKLCTQMSIMEGTEYALSYTDEIWLRNGQFLNQRKRHRKYTGHIYEKCLPLCIISPSSSVIRRDVFARIGLFDESLPVCEDYDLWLRICSRYPVLFIPEPLIIKRGGHPDQLSRNYETMDQYRIRSLARLLESGVLTEEQASQTLEELRRKCAVVGKGAQKRGKWDQAEYYLSLADKMERAIASKAVVT